MRQQLIANCPDIAAGEERPRMQSDADVEKHRNSTTFLANGFVGHIVGHIRQKKKKG